MKLSFFLSLVTILQLWANDSYSQFTKLTMNLENVKISEVLNQIENQSEFFFLYSPKLIDVDKKVDLITENEPIKDILNKIFGNEIKFAVYDRQIVLTPWEEPELRALTQQQKITGTITDSSSGEALPGVNILVKGTTFGTMSDANGKYSLEVTGKDAVLIFSFIGYVSQEVPVAGKSVIDVGLAADLLQLEEVVVIGYGTIKKSDLTGSVSSVKQATLQERPSTSLNQALAGRLTGVNVTVNSGRPGGRSDIRIRGNTSISNTNAPLYVIDGVILVQDVLANANNPIDYLNPNDITTIEILKDASATAIYGARGANGVVLVSTKRGSQSGARVDYDSEYSIGVLPHEIDVLNAAEFLHVEDVAYLNAQKFDPNGWASGKYTDPKLRRTDPKLFDANGNPLYDTDWQKETIQNAFSTNQQLSITGGNPKESYGAFLGYRNDNGLIKDSWLKRYSGRFVMDSQIKNWLKIGGNLSYNYQDESQNDRIGRGSADVHPQRQMLGSLPILPVKYPDGSWSSDADYFQLLPNPSQIRAERFYYLKTQTVLGNLYLNIKLSKNLEFRTTLGTNTLTQEVDFYSGRTINYLSRDQGGRAEVTNRRYRSWQFENYMTYSKKIAEIHSFIGLLGLSWQHLDQFNVTAASWQFSDDYFSYNNLSVGSNPRTPSSGSNAYGINSYFGRLNYSLKEKYLLTFTGRADGSSKFGSAKRYAFFPSAALAWRISEEDFIKNNFLVISDLKVRASYGITGNSEISPYSGLAGLGNYSVIFSGNRASGIGISRLANPDLKWEKTRQSDIGIELGLFENRISIEFDAYYKLTNDMLLSAPVPASSGYSSVNKNIGSMENRGIEFTLNTVNISSNDFSWSTSFNISVNKNEVLSLSVGNADIVTGAWGSNIIRVGEPVGSFYGFMRLGTWGTAEEVEAAKYFKKPGDIKFKDVNNDGMLNDADRVIIGKGIPTGFGTLLNTFRYKNFELKLDLQYCYGNHILNRGNMGNEDRQGLENSLATVLNAWTPENQNTFIAQWRPSSAGYDMRIDDYKTTDASFIRGRNLLLTYELSSEITKKLHIRNFRINASIQNFFLIWGRDKKWGNMTYKTLYDPESGTYAGSTDQTFSGSFDQGIVSYEYPRPRVYMLGLSFGI